MALKEKEIWPKWPVKISESGKVIFVDQDGWEKFKYPYYGKEMDIILKRRVKDRSRQEEKFYYAVVVRMVAENMEVSREEAHEILKNLFLRFEDTTVTGIRYERTMSTTELSDRAYREYWEKCINWAALPTGDDGLNQDSGLGLYIPKPNEIDYENSM